MWKEKNNKIGAEIKKNKYTIKRINEVKSSFYKETNQ